VSLKSRAELVLFGTTFIWGGTFTIVKLGMQEISPILLTSIRFTLAAAIITLLLYRTIFPLPRATLLRGGLLGLFLFIGFTTQNIGLTITTASKSAFITGTMVLFVPILQYLLERRSPRVGNVAGIGIVTVGLWLMTSPSGAGFNLGDLLTFGCAIAFAGYIVYLDMIAPTMHTSQVVFLQIVTTGVLSWITVAAFENPVFAMTGTSIGALLYLTLLATVLTTWLQSRFQKDTTPTRAVVIFSIEPVWASIIAAVAIGESLTGTGIAGGALILAGVLLSELSERIPVLNRPLLADQP
jgi:drug/metabolite transporter (DMT)-like permease